MIVVALVLGGAFLMWGMLAFYWLAPDFLTMAMQNFDVSDMLFMAFIAIMAVRILFLERRTLQTY